MGGGDASTQTGRDDRTEKQLADEWRKEDEEEEEEKERKEVFSQTGTHIIS